MSFEDISNGTSSDQEETSKKNVTFKQQTGQEIHATSHTHNSEDFTNIINFNCEDLKCKKGHEHLDQFISHDIINRDTFIDEPVNKKRKDPIKKHKCLEPGCNAAFTRPYRLKKHVVSHHTITYTSDEQESTSKKYIIIDPQTCDEGSEQLWRLNINNQKNHGIISENQETYMQVPANKQEKDHKCVEPGCNEAFTRPYRLKNHVISHHGGQKPFKCSFVGCEKNYSNQSHLKRHTILVHIRTEDHTGGVKCSEKDCGLIYANKNSLRKHIARVHRNLPFECHSCDEKFRRKIQLDLHKVVSHNEAAPYKCTECPKTFLQFHLYQKHRGRHKTYKCECEKSFGKFVEYLRHKKTACTLPKIKYNCPVCQKTFNAKENMTQHCLKVHLHNSESIKFKCSYPDCHNSYKYKRNLRVHIKTFHQKIFQYFKCTQESCLSILKSKQNLKQHLRLCHSDRPLKEGICRKPRKDRGLPKKSTEIFQLITSPEINCE